MKVFIDVLSGKVVASKENVTLTSSGIGSCVVIAAYNRKRNKACMAHVMFPDSPRAENSPPDTRFAEDAIDEIVTELAGPGKDGAGAIAACLIGGGNVLRRTNNSVCEEIIESVSSGLEKEGIKVVEKNLGGLERRSVFFDTEKGEVSFRIADGKEKLLCRL